MASVNSGANIGFKVGTQAAVDLLLAAGSNAGATHGTFYLTSDTHRLYIGNSDTSLSSVNEGVITVADTNHLPITSESITGTFYYAAAENILCVYNGQQWVQVNTFTDTTISSNTFSSWEVATNQVGVADSIAQSNGQTKIGRFVIKGDNGNTVTQTTTTVTVNGSDYTVPMITVAGDTYTLSTATKTGGGGVDIKLDSANTTHDSKVTLVPGNSNATIEASGDTVTITTLNAENNTLAITERTAAQGNGFNIAITDNYGKTVQDATDPVVRVGQTPQDVHFDSGIATLPVYTRTEIDNKMTSLNAMTYRGTLGPTGTGATTIGVTGGKVTIKKDSTTLNVSIGDSFLVADDYQTSYTDPITNETIYVDPRSLLIARSSDGTENSNGYIDPSKLTFDIVRDTADTDTSYKFVDTTNGLYLQDVNGQNTGLIKVQGHTTTGAADITITETKSTLSGSNGASKTFVVSHDPVTRTNTTTNTIYSDGGAIANAGSNKYVASTVTIPVITGISTDATGHITAVTTTPYELYDTTTDVTLTPAASSYTKNKVNSGIIDLKLDQKTAYNKAATTEHDRFGLSSETLTINQYDSATIDSSSSTTVKGLKIEMIWGSF